MINRIKKVFNECLDKAICENFKKRELQLTEEQQEEFEKIYGTHSDILEKYFTMYSYYGGLYGAIFASKTIFKYEMLVLALIITCKLMVN